MNVGVLGCGNIAQSHLPHILKHHGVQTVSVADPDRRTAEETARRFRIKNIHTDFDAMRREQDLDVVHVLTPPATHGELAVKAMEAGCHVLVEKPMALTLEEADAMLVAARKNHVKLCVDYNSLWQPAMMRARKLVEEGKVGRVLHVDTQYCIDIKRVGINSADGRSKRNWILSMPGGPLFDSIPHPASILLHFLKDPVKVWAVSKRNGTLPENLPDELRVLVDARNVTGSLSVSLGIRPDYFTVDIYGTQMSVHVNLSNMTALTRRDLPVPKPISRAFSNVEQSMQLLYTTFSNSLKLLTGVVRPPGDVGPVITRFYESIENGSEPPVSGEDGMALVRFTNELQEQVA